MLESDKAKKKNKVGKGDLKKKKECLCVWSGQMRPHWEGDICVKI